MCGSLEGNRDMILCALAFPFLIPAGTKQARRRYHMFKYGKYPLPNDDDEYRREAMRHTMLKELLGGKLYLAPIGDNPQRIVDLGTGFGEWAIEGTYDRIWLDSWLTGGWLVGLGSG